VSFIVILVIASITGAAVFRRGRIDPRQLRNAVTMRYPAITTCQTVALATTLLMAIAGTVILPASASVRHQQPKSTDRNEDWVKPEYHGLIVGKSTTSDVIREFGKPAWKGGVQELAVPSDKEGEIQYEYPAVPDVGGYMKIYFGKRSGVVTAIMIYPKQMTRADAITKFGADFEESNEKLGPCPTARERKLVEQYHVEYGLLLVYRKLGLYVDIKKDGTAFLIAYLRSCR